MCVCCFSFLNRIVWNNLCSVFWKFVSAHSFVFCFFKRRHSALNTPIVHCGEHILHLACKSLPLDQLNPTEAFATHGSRKHKAMKVQNAVHRTALEPYGMLSIVLSGRAVAGKTGTLVNGWPMSMISRSGLAGSLMGAFEPTQSTRKKCGVRCETPRSR